MASQRPPRSGSKPGGPLLEALPLPPPLPPPPPQPRHFLPSFAWGCNRAARVRVAVQEGRRSLDASRRGSLEGGRPPGDAHGGAFMQARPPAYQPAPVSSARLHLLRPRAASLTGCRALKATRPASVKAMPALILHLLGGLPVMQEACMHCRHARSMPEGRCPGRR